LIRFCYFIGSTSAAILQSSTMYSLPMAVMDDGFDRDASFPSLTNSRHSHSLRQKTNVIGLIYDEVSAGDGPWCYT
jgi:hypothetical protein